MDIILLNKPYRVLSQFRDRDGRQTLAGLIQRPNYYPAGRLDYDSEGLLLLTDSGAVQHRVANPQNKMEKTYWVQVEGEPSQPSIQQLRRGIELRDGKTKPAGIARMDTPTLWARRPAVTPHRASRSHWLEISLKEGRNRQVRRMLAAVGLPVLRLVRIGIGPWRLDNLQPGESRLETIHLPRTGKKTERR